MDERLELLKNIDKLDKALQLTKIQRDRARYDLEIFANEYSQLVRQVKRIPKWVRKIYRIRLGTGSVK